MTSGLQVSIAQATDKGRKSCNQDYHAACIPQEPQLGAKGVVIALADGIGSSDVSHEASRTAVQGFLADYYCTSDAWSVKTSAQRVLTATNSWLYAQTRRSQFRYDLDRGYVCTFSALILKSTTAHVFHAGDARVYRLRDGVIEQLTTDHRVQVAGEKSYLARALGVSQQLEIDYHALPLRVADVFLLMTDGVHEYVGERFLIDAVAGCDDDPAVAVKRILEEALRQGSGDNLTVQLLRVDHLPAQQVDEVRQQLTELPLPPVLEAGMMIDGYRIIRDLHVSSRSHVHLAIDEGSGAQVAIKTPSLDLRGDPLYLERFLMEEWVARRVSSAHVLKAGAPTRRRNYIYTVSEYIDGQTLRQWMADHPQPDLETVRSMLEQIARGLRAFHRQEMLHQDLRPENIMIDGNGTLKIIDFGAVRVAGIAEVDLPQRFDGLLGTAQYAAPEYFLGEAGSVRSDLFSLGVIAYQMLAAGRLPYDAEVAKCRNRAAQRKLQYHSLLTTNRQLPPWVDETIRQALQINPEKRYAELSEFLFDLRFPNKRFLHRARPPLLERNPAGFWKSVSLLLALVLLGVLLYR